MRFRVSSGDSEHPATAGSMRQLLEQDCLRPAVVRVRILPFERKLSQKRRIRWWTALVCTKAQETSHPAQRLADFRIKWLRGGMAEWSMAVVLKTTVPGRVPGVRIPLPPPDEYRPPRSAASDAGSRPHCRRAMLPIVLVA